MFWQLKVFSMFTKIKNYIKKSPHRNQLEKYISDFLPKLEGNTLDVGSKNRRYDYLLKNKPTAIDLVENKVRGVSAGDINKLDFEMGSFDNVICLEVLEYVGTPQIAISEIARVMKSKGTLILSVPFMYREHEDMLRYTKEYLNKELNKYFLNVEFFSVGNAYSIILDVLKHKINKIRFRLLRYFCLVFYLPFALLIEVVKPSKKSEFVSGYFVVAKKI